MVSDQPQETFEMGHSPSAWTRFPIWDRWRDLTRFRIAAEAAISSEHRHWTSIAVDDSDSITVKDPSGRTKFKCKLRDYLDALSSNHQLYAMLLQSYTGLVEEHGRDIVNEIISSKGKSRSLLPGLDSSLPADIASEKYIVEMPIEQWGASILKAVQRDEKNWTDVVGGKALVVEAYAVRNITVHGLLAMNQKAFNRIVV